MQVLQSKPKTQQYAMKKDIGRIFGYRDPSRLVKSYRKYADAHPNKFNPHKAYIKNEGMDYLYDILCFGYYLEYRDLLEAETRSITFQKELPRLKEVYQV